MQPYKYFSICEYLGSLFLVIAAIAPIILFVNVFNTTIAIAVIADALAVAFVLIALIEIFGPICTGYFNPAVTIAMVLDKQIRWTQALRYIYSQILGGLTGVIVVHLMFYHEIPILYDISSISRNGGAYFAEIIGTFFLILAIFSLIHQKSDKISLIIGSLVGGMLLSTSSTMFANPQISIARIFTYSEAGISPFDAMVFIIMELIGAILAVVVWKFVNKSSRFCNKSG